MVAETSMQPAAVGQESSPSSPAGEGGSAFNTLAGYLFGANQQKEKMKMTMPVFTDSKGNMQFVISSKKASLMHRRGKIVKFCRYVKRHDCCSYVYV